MKNETNREECSSPLQLVHDACSDRDLEGCELPANLRNLSLNKNQLTDLSRVLGSLAQATHALHYISLVGI
jgi:hypothetical protein